MEILAGLAVSFLVQSAVLTGADVEYLRHPSLEGLFAMTEAPASGHAIVECEVAADGWLRRCRTIQVSDDRLADDLAEMAKDFRVGPETRAGEPTAGRILQVSIRWNDGE